MDRDHDLLTKIDVNLTNFMDQFNKHVQEDKVSQEKHEDRLSRLEKWGAMAVGALGLLQFIVSHIWK